MATLNGPRAGAEGTDGCLAVVGSALLLEQASGCTLAARVTPCRRSIIVLPPPHPTKGGPEYEYVAVGE